MPMFKNTSGKVLVYAVDLTTGLPETGDAANITGYVTLDGGAANVIDDTNPSEIDATNLPGFYVFDVTAAETNGDLFGLIAKSSTANIQLDPVMVFTGLAVPVVNATQISGDSTAADNLEATYDGTGYADDDAPATQAQVANIGFGTSADSVVATSDSNTPTGAETLTYAATYALDASYHEVAPDGGNIDQRYRFNVGGGAAGTSIQWKGNVTTINDSVTVSANTGTVASPTWQTIGTIDGKATATIETHTFDLFAGHTMTGTDIGEVEIRFASADATNLRTDQILCQRAITSQSIGYANGQIWIDTVNGTAGTTVGTHGVADNPALLWADALTLNTALNNLNHFHLAPGTTVTLAASADGFIMEGDGATVALGGQSVSGTVFRGLTITGNDDGSNGSATDYDHCEFGAHTLGKFHAGNCHFEGAIVLAEAAVYEMHDCQSDSDASFDYGAAVAVSEIHAYNHSGVLEIKQFSDTGSDILLLSGRGELVINANCTAAGTITIAGPWALDDNVGGGFVTGGGTLNEDARYDVAQVNAQVDAAIETYKLDHLVAVADSDDVVNDSIIAKMAATAGDWSTFVKTTDSLQAARDQVAALNDITAADVVTALGTGSTLTSLAMASALATVDGILDTVAATIAKYETMVELDGVVYQFTSNALEEGPAGVNIAQDVWEYATRVLTASTNFNDLSAAEVNAECDTALTDYDPPTQTEAAALAVAIISEIDDNEAKIDIIDTNVDAIVLGSNYILSTTVSAADSTTSFTLTAGKAANDAFNGMQIQITDADDDNVEIRQITDWTSGRVVTVDDAFSFTPAIGDSAKITTGYGRDDWVSGGGGGVTDTFTVEDAGTDPIAGADVWVSTNESGSNIIAGVSTTNALGIVTFNLDITTGLWVHGQRAGYMLSGYPKQFNVAAGGFSWA